jgi:WD40 repeat protein
MLLSTFSLRPSTVIDQIRLWDVNQGHVWSWERPADFSATTLAWSPDGSRLALGGAETVFIIRDGELVQRHTGHKAVHAVSWNPEQPRIAVADETNTVRIWDVLKGTSHQITAAEDGAVLSVAWMSANLLAAGFADGKLCVCDVSTGEVLSRPEINGSQPISRPSASPAGRLLAVVGQPDVIELWSADQSPRLLYRLPCDSGSVTEIAWLDNGKGPVAATSSGELKTWDLSESVPTAKNQHVGPISLSADGRYMAEYFGARRICRVQVDECLGVLVGVRGNHVMQISPEGHYLASGDVSDEIVYVAELDNGERVTLKQEDFEKRFGWKNDPERAKIKLD